MNITQQELDKTFEQFKSSYGGVKNDYFGLHYISKKFNKTFEEISHEVAFGNHDYGIDGFHIDRETKVLYLYQFKWSKDYNLFKESYNRLIQDGFERIFGNPFQDNKQNTIIPYLKKALIENRSIIENVLISFVFNGEIELAEKSSVLETLRENLESKSYLIKQFFDNRPIITAPIYESNNNNKVSEIKFNRTVYSYELSIDNFAPLVAKNGLPTLNFGLINLIDLHKMHKEMGQRLFDRNIRYGLSIENSPNRSIKKTLEKIVLKGEGESADSFTFNHNGITLFVESIQQVDDKVKIIEPRILNGAQTVTTFKQFIDSNKDNRTLKDNEDILNSIKVFSKIISKASKEFVTNVTICNNRQNPVKPWNLRANDDIQLDFQDKFAKLENGIYYERQENAFESLQDSDLEDMGITEKYKKIELIKLAQTFLALQGEIDKMSSLSEVFESEITYGNTFKQSYLQANVNKLILIYKVQLRLGSIIKEIRNQNWGNYYYYDKAKYLIWSLLIQGLLNDNKLEKLIENFGNSMISETEFTDKLKRMATNEVRQVIREVVTANYKEQERNQKFSFLKTKTIFQKCMDLANQKFGWTKRTL